MDRSKAATDAASVLTLRSGLATAMVLYPALASSAITPFQLEASANAPCTRTMVGSWACAVALDAAPRAMVSVTASIDLSMFITVLAFGASLDRT